MSICFTLFTFGGFMTICNNYIILFVLQEVGDITEGVRLVDNLIEHIGINESNYFVYRWAGPVCSPSPLTLHVQAAPASQSSRCTKSHQLPD